MTAFDAEALPDVAVIGARSCSGIGGCARKCAFRRENRVFLRSPDAVGNHACNPAIGGTGQGTPSFERIDAPGVEMARAADAACIQYRMLNRGKGLPVVHSRVRRPTELLQSVYGSTYCPGAAVKNLAFMQDEVVAIERQDGAVSAIATAVGVCAMQRQGGRCRSSTFLGGRVIIGEYTRIWLDESGGGKASHRVAARSGTAQLLQDRHAAARQPPPPLD